MLAKLELFHTLTEPDSAEARKAVERLGLTDRVHLRNVSFDSHLEALRAKGGATTPALWDGERLHVGSEAIIAALSNTAIE